MFSYLLLPPHHLIHNPHIALNYLDHLGADVFIDIVRHGDAVVAICVHLYGCVNGLKEALFVDAADKEAAFVEGFGTFGAGADADCRERVADRCEEAAFLWQGARVRDHCKGVHLEAVVVVEAEGFVLDDAGVELESAGFESLAAAGVAAVENRHIIFLRHCVDGVEKAEEILLSVDVLLAVGTQKNVAALLQAEALVHVGSLYLGEVVVQNLRHWGTSNVGALAREAAFGKIAAGVLGVGHVDVGDDVYDAAVGLFGEAFVFAAVAGFHVEDWNMQTLCANNREAGVGITQDQHCIWLNLNHQLVGLVDDITHRLAKVGADCVHIDFRVGEFEVFEENSVKVIIVVLACVSEDGVEVLAALVDDCRKAYDFRPRAHYDKKLQLAVVLEG